MSRREPLPEIFQGYGAKTLVTGWHFPERIAKDHDAYHPPGGSQFMSTYRRLGSYEEPAIKSESKATQEQALIKRKAPAKKPLINMISYSSTLGETRRNYWKDTDISLPPDNIDCTNYITTSKSDYINFHPEKPTVISRVLLQKPETKFRRLLVDGYDPRRPGYNTFYDDNQEYLNTRKKRREHPPFGLCYEPKPY
ncbi:uncharacterized protein [Halyomorpha halys]|uniref:uncharacterized protein n=1 Tax=Halyomorpha halys TaxID=286706 RepID=UPI0006D5288E|nr:uncharacterized protein LOC106687092 [Halyomorpha halys]